MFVLQCFVMTLLFGQPIGHTAVKKIASTIFEGFWNLGDHQLTLVYLEKTCVNICLASVF